MIEAEIAAKVRREVAEEIAQAIEARIRTWAGMSNHAKESGS
jgi:hypothetical protein